MRALVQDPMNTLSIWMSRIGMPGVNAMYSKSSLRGLTELLIILMVRGSGTFPSTPVTIPGLVPHVTCGAIVSARSSTTAS